MSLLWRWSGGSWESEGHSSPWFDEGKETSRWWLVHVKPIYESLIWVGTVPLLFPNLNPWVTSQLVCGLAELQDTSGCSTAPSASASSTRKLRSLQRPLGQSFFRHGYSISTHAYIELSGPQLSLAVAVGAGHWFWPQWLQVASTLTVLWLCLSHYHMFGRCNTGNTDKGNI